MRTLSLLLLLPLSGCGAEEAAPPPPAAVAESVDSFPAEVAGRPLIPARGVEEEWSIREVGHAPRYFLASGWAGADSLWGLAGNTPAFVHVTEPEYRVVRRPYWEMARSPRGALAGIDERGVWVDARLLLDRATPGEGDLSGPLLWSPDGARLLARRVREGPALHLLVEVASGAVTPLPLRADSLWLGEPSWTPDGRILLTAHPSLDPERGPVGRGDLYLHDPAGGETRRVARAAEGAFLRPLAPWGERAVLVGEGASGIGASNRFRIYDAAAWSSREIDLPSADRVVARDTALALLVARRRSSGYPVHHLYLWRAGQGAHPFASVRGRDVRVLWSPDGSRLAISAAGEEIDETGGSVNAYYRTWIVQPR